METKRIFVLGNGFDLAHYLPTAYVHFMDAMKIVESSGGDTELGFNDLFQKYVSGECSERDEDFFQKTKDFYKTDGLKLSTDIVNDLREKLKSNSWFQHFKHHLTDVDTWIDFENEIEKVLFSFDTIFNIDFDSGTISDDEYFINYGTEPIISLKNILDDKEKRFDSKLLNVTGVKTEYFLNLLKNFGILKKIYGHIIYELENKPRMHPTYRRQDSNRLERQHYDSLVDYREKKINEYTTQTNTKRFFDNIIETRYLSRNSTVYTSFKEDEVYKKVLKNLESFSEIFTIYINLVINQLEPAKPFDTFGDLAKEIDTVYTFNYSDTFERLYPKSIEDQLNQIEVQYIHGSAEQENIVLGISDLEEKSLKKYKIYGFVKTFQKLINNTDYMFLDDTNIRAITDYSGVRGKITEKYEIIIWGHSLDASDSEYIKEIFNLNDASSLHQVIVMIWCHGSPHTQLANLMHIMGKDIIQEWMKKKWLVFEIAPNIYEENHRKK